MEKTLETLKDQWKVFKEENPKTRIREAASILGTTEAELVATGLNDHNTLLQNDFPALLKEVEKLGKVMAITRNDHCVNERKGIYHKLTFQGIMGLAVNPDIDLRLFMNNWHFGFAVNENDRLSFQFFAKNGEAVHKIYLLPESNTEAYHELVARYKAEDQDQLLITEPSVRYSIEKPDTEIDAAAFRKAWLDLKDTHQFHEMLKGFGVVRIQAMRLAPAGHTAPLSIDAFKKIFADVASKSLPIMIFTGSKGCIQIHTGEIHKIVEMGPWYNILDPEFNMHLRTDGIVSIYIVKKPTDDGIVTSLEFFDANGDIIMQVFGKRKPGMPESEEWRSIVNTFI